MEKLFEKLLRLFLRLRYPATMPQDVGNDLGVPLSNFITFDQLMTCLAAPELRPARLSKFMPREEAEKVFETALRKERFQANSLFSYYFHEGWMEFFLQFDEKSRLRRIYLQHRRIPQDRGIEIALQ